MGEQAFLGYLMIAAAIYFGGCVFVGQGVGLWAGTREEKESAGRVLMLLGMFFMLAGVVVVVLAMATSC